ncbi:hypothetical protein [Wolbachia endosymbiont of Drosophila tsacasi]|uniref:hypothetical protein n=1 Tax=Wolbachia endosymbiont of Drosophila tsacasi TaxID=3002579 RepID=UPI0023A9196E|nr:hypothetical protein [Wolbachia endosymbiont of Drosophila tsacasi]MDE5061711.1 hypothetical protein [Wolbachia endosymbiont of Drosophila tsacasi]
MKTVNGVIKVADASSTSYRRGISADPVNKQRDDDCQASAPIMSSQCLFLCHPSAQTLGSRKKNDVMKVADTYDGVIRVAPFLSSQCLDYLDPGNLTLHQVNVQ